MHDEIDEEVAKSVEVNEKQLDDIRFVVDTKKHDGGDLSPEDSIAFALWQIEQTLEVIAYYLSRIAPAIEDDDDDEE